MHTLRHTHMMSSKADILLFCCGELLGDAISSVPSQHLQHSFGASITLAWTSVDLQRPCISLSAGGPSTGLAPSLHLARLPSASPHHISSPAPTHSALVFALSPGRVFQGPSLLADISHSVDGCTTFSPRSPGHHVLIFTYPFLIPTSPPTPLLHFGQQDLLCRYAPPPPHVCLVHHQCFCHQCPSCPSVPVDWPSSLHPGTLGCWVLVPS